MNVMVKFINSTDEGKAALGKRLVDELSGGPDVLWLVPGGSNIGAAVETMRAIPDGLSGRLTVTLTDERFGPVGHAESNWFQLESAGFDTKNAVAVPVLTGLGDMESTAAAFAAKLDSLFSQSRVIIGHVGMGDDGHIAGILPHSPAVSARGLVCHYRTPTRDRISCTFDAIRRFTAVFLITSGEGKRAPLANLRRDLSLDDQPAQILKELTEAYVFHDAPGEE